MNEENDHTTGTRFSVADLAALTGFSERTVRYYMQEKLLPPAEGASRRSAYYTQRHLRTLLDIAQWQKDGIVQIDRLRQLVEARESGPAQLPPAPPRPGDITVVSRIHLKPGIELQVDAAQASLTPEAVRELVRKVTAAIDDANGT